MEHTAAAAAISLPLSKVHSTHSHSQSRFTECTSELSRKIPSGYGLRQRGRERGGGREWELERARLAFPCFPGGAAAATTKNRSVADLPLLLGRNWILPALLPSPTRLPSLRCSCVHNRQRNRDLEIYNGNGTVRVLATSAAPHDLLPITRRAIC